MAGTILVVLQRVLTTKRGSYDDTIFWLFNPVGLLIFGMVFAVWTAGIAVFGIPVWWVLERLNLTRWYHAVCVGFVLPFLIVTLFAAAGDFLGKGSGNRYSYDDDGGTVVTDGWRTPHGWNTLITQAAILGGDGAVIGYLTWLLGYNRARQKSDCGDADNAQAH